MIEVICLDGRAKFLAIEVIREDGCTSDNLVIGIKFEDG